MKASWHLYDSFQKKEHDQPTPLLYDLTSFFMLPDLGEIARAKLEFNGAGHNTEPYVAGGMTKRPNAALFANAVKTEVCDEL